MLLFLLLLLTIESKDVGAISECAFEIARSRFVFRLGVQWRCNGKTIATIKGNVRQSVGLYCFNFSVYSFCPSFCPFVRPSVRPFVRLSVRPNARKSVGFSAVERAYGRASLQVCASICIGFSSLLSIQQVLPPLSPLPPGVTNSQKNAKESFSIKKEKKREKKRRDKTEGSYSTTLS